MTLEYNFDYDNGEKVTVGGVDKFNCKVNFPDLDGKYYYHLKFDIPFNRANIRQLVSAARAELKAKIQENKTLRADFKTNLQAEFPEIFVKEVEK